MTFRERLGFAVAVFGQNLVYGITLGLATLMSLGGAVYNLLRLLAARHRRHSAPGDA